MLEYVGGDIKQVTEEDLSNRYHTFVIELNANQSLELAFLIADLMKHRRDA